MISELTEFPVSSKTKKLVRRLNAEFLGLNLSGITFHEYDVDKSHTFKVMFSVARTQDIYLERGNIPSAPDYAAFMLAHEVGHLRLGHFGSKKKPGEEFAASHFAQGVIAGKIGPQAARRLITRWVRDWLRIARR